MLQLLIEAHVKEQNRDCLCVQILTRLTPSQLVTQDKWLEFAKEKLINALDNSINFKEHYNLSVINALY